jgi:hypothetical protein
MSIGKIFDFFHFFDQTFFFESPFILLLSHKVKKNGQLAVFLILDFNKVFAK